MGCDVAYKCGLEPELPWLWSWPAAAALIQPLAWARPYAAKKRKKKKRKMGVDDFILASNKEKSFKNSLKMTRGKQK